VRRLKITGMICLLTDTRI